MEITRSEAAAALQDVERMQARGMEMRGYRIAGPHLILWGAIWAVGYGLMAVRPQSEWGLIWLPLDAIGIAVSIVGLGAGSYSRERKGAGGMGWRMMIGILFVALFMAATYTVFAPATPMPMIVFPGMVVGMIYVAAGLAWMTRLAWIGASIFLLTIVGFLLFQPWLLWWMAVVGGGGLALGGLWLRKA